MGFDSEHKKKIEDAIVEVLIDSVEKKLITEDQLPQISDFVLGRIDEIKNHDELLIFLSDLKAKWPIFANLEEIERGEANDVKEDKATEDILEMAKEGKIDDAIDLAKRTMGE